MDKKAKDLVITEDAFFDEQRSLFYPSPEITGKGEWAEAAQLARKTVQQMTLKEKVCIVILLTASWLYV